MVSNNATIEQKKMINSISTQTKITRLTWDLLDEKWKDQFRIYINKKNQLEMIYQMRNKRIDLKFI